MATPCRDTPAPTAPVREATLWLLVPSRYGLSANLCAFLTDYRSKTLTRTEFHARC